MNHTMAFIGAGWIGDFYHQAYQMLRDRFTLAGCSGNPSEEGRRRLLSKCGEWNAAPIFDLDAILGDPSITCVCILSPTSLHFEQAKAALLAGKHVLIEKPVALDAAQFEELRDLAAERNLTVLPGHNFVYRPVIRKAREILDSGRLGTVSYGSFRAVHFISPEHASGWRSRFDISGGGAMMDSGTHLVYQSIYLLGLPRWLSCFSTTKHYTEMESEDTCQISLQYGDGIIGQIFQSWSSSDPSAGEIRIEGDEGNLLITDALYLDGERIEDDSTYPRSFYHLLAAFADAMEGKAAPLSSIDDARAAFGIISSAYESAMDRRTMELRL